jgi:hypothetical protein
VAIDVKATGEEVDVASPRGIRVGDQRDLALGVHGLDVCHFEQPEHAPQPIPENLIPCHAPGLLFCQIDGEKKRCVTRLQYGDGSGF